MCCEHLWDSVFERHVLIGLRVVCRMRVLLFIADPGLRDVGGSTGVVDWMAVSSRRSRGCGDCGDWIGPGSQTVVLG